MAEERYVIRSIMGCKYERMPEIKWLGVEPSVLHGHAEPEMEAFRAEAEKRKAEVMRGTRIRPSATAPHTPSCSTT